MINVPFSWDVYSQLYDCEFVALYFRVSVLPSVNRGEAKLLPESNYHCTEMSWRQNIICHAPQRLCLLGISFVFSNSDGKSFLKANFFGPIKINWWVESFKLLSNFEENEFPQNVVNLKKNGMLIAVVNYRLVWIMCKIFPFFRKTF